MCVCCFKSSRLSLRKFYDDDPLPKRCNVGMHVRIICMYMYVRTYVRVRIIIINYRHINRDMGTKHSASFSVRGRHHKTTLSEPVTMPNMNNSIVRT